MAARRDSRPSIEGCQLNVNKEVTAKNGGNEWGNSFDRGRKLVGSKPNRVEQVIKDNHQTDDLVDKIANKAIGQVTSNLLAIN